LPVFDFIQSVEENETAAGGYRRPYCFLRHPGEPRIMRDVTARFVCEVKGCRLLGERAQTLGKASQFQ